MMELNSTFRFSVNLPFWLEPFRRWVVVEPAWSINGQELEIDRVDESPEVRNVYWKVRPTEAAT